MAFNILKIMNKVKMLKKFHHQRNIIIDKKNLIKTKKASLDAIKGNNIIVMDDSFIDSNSRIGNYTYIGCNCFITKALIGNYVSIANGVSIGMGEHDLNKLSTNSLFYSSPYEELTKKDCIIANDVWIGVNSIIRRGIKIGNGAVIGANSFVNKDVPDYTVVVGSPAKIIKYRFSTDQIKFLNDSKWWDYPLDEAKSILETIETEFSKRT